MTDVVLDNLGKPIWSSTWAEEGAKLRQENKRLRRELKAAVEIGAKALYSYTANQLYPDDPTPTLIKELGLMKRAIHRTIKEMTE